MAAFLPAGAWGAPWELEGSLSLNWRNVGPREPGFETQIQNEVYLADVYFGFRGPPIEGVPFLLEFHVPTGSQGTPSLYRLFFRYDRLRDWKFDLGKFLVPGGVYNELYRPDTFLTVTRPLLYASPDSLDLVVRINSPRPLITSGYTDLGARASYYPPTKRSYLPSEITAYVVNGLGESANRQRTFPKPENLGIEAPPPNGVSLDFGHENNNLADTNNNKSVGGRMVFALGDQRLPWPIPEGQRDLNGVSLGLSALQGRYDLEEHLLHYLLGADAAFEYLGLRFSAEYGFQWSGFSSPVTTNTATVVSDVFEREHEINRGYYVQVAVPVKVAPPWGKRATAVLGFSQMTRRGPEMTLLTNQKIGGTTFPSIAAIRDNRERITTKLDKYTVALNWRLTGNFIFKTEYAYWDMTRATTDPVSGSIYQTAFSMVLSF